MACAALLAVSCGSNKKAGIEQVSGLINGGTSMHVLVVDLIGSKGGQKTFALDDATDLKEAYGLLEGNLVTVDYKAATEADRVPVAVKVVCSKEYADAVGRWVTPDPIQKDALMGVELMVEGKAQSINMATLQYTSWELQGEPGKLILHGQSIGNGQTIEVTETAVLADKGGVQTLTIEGSEVVYTKAE